MRDDEREPDAGVEMASRVYRALTEFGELARIERQAIAEERTARTDFARQFGEWSARQAGMEERVAGLTNLCDRLAAVVLYGNGEPSLRAAVKDCERWITDHKQACRTQSVEESAAANRRIKLLCAFIAGASAIICTAITLLIAKHS